MKSKAKFIVASVIVLATALVAIALWRQQRWEIEHLLLWAAVCILGERFWLKTQSGDSVQSLAAAVNLAAILVLDPWAALLVIYGSTVTGNFLFRRSKWYRALYNGSQITLCAGAALFVLHLLGGSSLVDVYHLAGKARLDAVADTLADRRFLSAYLLAGLAYFGVNHAIMAMLMNALTGRRIWVILKESSLYAAEIQSNLAQFLLPPLLVLLYGGLGAVGLVAVFACLGLVHAANRRYMALAAAQDNLVLSERMTAMGEMAEEIGQSLGNYLSELKLSANRLFQRARHSDGEKVLKSAEIVHVNVDNMSALVDGLAAFSHQETHKVPTDLNELLRRTVDFVKPQNRFDSVHFKITPDPILPLVNVDPAQIQQVLINLLTNASDALKEVDRPIKKIFIETAYDPDAQRIRIAVTDNGPGVPEAHLNRVFEPHFTTKVTGHGFGLSTVFRIATNHKGRITASNQPGGGARFLLDLPNA